MAKQNPDNSDVSDAYQKWARSNLTGSLRRTGAACMAGVVTTSELAEIINEIRNRPDCQVSRMDPSKQQWLEAISTCNLFEIQKILKEDPGLINWKNPCDGTALHYAAKEGNVKCLNYLMQRGDIDINAQCGGWTPLHVAVLYSQRLFIRTLVETYHAKNDIMDYSGKFPVDLLATEELKEELTELLSQGRIARIRKKAGGVPQFKQNRRTSLQQTCKLAMALILFINDLPPGSLASRSLVGSLGVPTSETSAEDPSAAIDSQKVDIATPTTSKMSSTDRFPSFSAPQMPRSVSILGLKSLETMWNSRKTSMTNGKKNQGADDSKASESEAYTQLLLSTLCRDREYAINMFRRLQHRDFAYTTPEALLEELNGGSEAEEEKTRKKSHSFKRGSVFKVPHLPHPPKNLISGGSAVANAASGLIKMGETMMKSFQKQKDDSVKTVKKNSAATLSIRREKKNVSGLMERHSIAGIENLGSRMAIGSSISSIPVETLNSRGGWISRHPSYLSDCISSSSNTGPADESTPSSLSMRRNSSQSSLVARTEELFNQYFAPPSPLPSPPKRHSRSPSHQ